MRACVCMWLQMQQQELAQIRQRDANLTALAAIGPRKKRKLDSPSLGTDAEVRNVSLSSSRSAAFHLVFFSPLPSVNHLALVEQLGDVRLWFKGLGM